MSSLKDEKLQILKMIEEGKITSDEGINLLETLEDTEKSSIINDKTANWVKIRVFDPGDSTKVNVTIPVSLIDVGLKIANKVSPDLKASGIEEKDLKEIFEAIQSGASGKLIDIERENGEKVEITVE